MRKRDSIPLWVCIVASVGIHVMVLAPTIGGALASGVSTTAANLDLLKPDEATPPEPATETERPNPLMRRPVEMERVQLGIDNGSEQPLTTWIGYDEYQEHLARLSEIDQAALRMTDGGGGEPAAAPAGAMSQASPQTPPIPESAPPSPITAADRAADTGQLPRARPSAPDPVNTANAPPAPTRATEAPVPAPTPPFAQTRSPAPPTARPTTDPPAEPTTEPIAASAASETPGRAVATPTPAPGLALPHATDVPTSPDGNPLPPEPAKGEAPKPDPLVRPVEDRGAAEKPPEEPTPADEPPAPAPPREVPVKPAPPPAEATPPAMAPTKPEPSPPESTAEPRTAPVPQDIDTAPPHHEPDRAAPPSPPPRPEAAPAPSDAPGAPTQPAATPGPPVTGELTDREADATSTIDVPADRWKNGKPLAARGLQILTRRPEMLPEYLAIQVGPGRNPVFELQFDSRGVVRKVVMLESSGAGQLDDRLIDCLYKWRARGERLKSIKPDDRLKLSMRMLVR